MSWLLGFFSREWSGLAVGAALCGGGFLLCLLAVATWQMVLGLLIVGDGLIIAAGSTRNLLYLRSLHARHPPPGRFIDIGGYAVHLLAEGEARGNASVVWFPGGHSASAYLRHLHDAIRQHGRSILIDRPGTGWSDTGPFPRSTARESEEMIAALEASGEAGPFVLVGHSFGGLLAANIAHRRPDLVSALVLLDATPPETICFGPRLPELGQMRKDAFQSGLLHWLGIHHDFAQARLDEDHNPLVRQTLSAMDSCLGETVSVATAVDTRARTYFVNLSIFSELTPEGMVRSAWDTVVYDGDLGDMPVYLVAPGDALEVTEMVEEMGNTAKKEHPHNPQSQQAARMARFFSKTRERYMAVSEASTRVVTPKGTGHNFPYEAPDFVVNLVRDILLRTK